MSKTIAMPPQDSLKRAASYLRVSTSAQADTDYNSEGYSIPAQREANLRAAEREGAVIVAEFIDRGESAKTADREGLQDLLAYIAANPVDLVIVHKVDRLARNRVDDVEIGLAIRRAGAKLISATENIDETPSGKLLHGVMSAVAEFYSLNLATEAKKGMRQKAKSGGTPGRAPLGYLNVREMVEGREIRTIAIDPERSPHIVWAFEAYATGEWTIFQLTEELNRRGLRTKKSAKTPERPLYSSHVEKILGNPYYAGIVSYEGVEYEGRHEPLITPELFEKVQAMKKARANAREKVTQHPHYLKGTLFCGYCGSRLALTNAKGHLGKIYPYWYCLGRQTHKNLCPQSFIPRATLEKAVEDYWHNVRLPNVRIAQMRDAILGYIHGSKERSAKELERQRLRLRQLGDQRTKLLQAHYAGAIPLDLLKAEQERLTRETVEASALIDAHELSYAQIEESLETVFTLCANAHQIYLEASPGMRRLLNQTVFARLIVHDHEITDAQLASPYAEVLTDPVEEVSDTTGTVLTDDQDAAPRATGTTEDMPAHDYTRVRTAETASDATSSLADLDLWQQQNPTSGGRRGLKVRFLVRSSRLGLSWANGAWLAG